MSPARSSNSDATQAAKGAPERPLPDIPDLTGRSILIVSAPFGPFSRRLAEVLREHGAEVTRMIFNAGDLLDWGFRNAVFHRRSQRSWRNGLVARVNGYTDILLFGEAGDYNQAVLDQIDDIKASVWVIENGYFRPHWVTMERNGVNARSTLPRSAEGYPAPAPREPPFEEVGTVLPYHVWNLSLYHFVLMLGRPFFLGYSPPYRRHEAIQAVGHTWRYFRLRFSSSRRADTEVIAARGPFFIACLQREGDATLLRYSDYQTNTTFLERVIEDFSRTAPKAMRLVVKNHPLDPGLVDYKGRVRRFARQYGVEGRVDFIDGGNLATLCRKSNGMVVNNSTAALAAVGFGSPVKVLGRAFFDFQGLTDQKPLSDFWNAPEKPDHDLFIRFREHVLHRTQINGSYHNPQRQVWTAWRMALALAGGWDKAQKDGAQKDGAQKDRAQKDGTRKGRTRKDRSRKG